MDQEPRDFLASMEARLTATIEQRFTAVEERLAALEERITAVGHRAAQRSDRYEASGATGTRQKGSKPGDHVPTMTLATLFDERIAFLERRIFDLERRRSA